MIIIKLYTNLHYFNVSVGQCEIQLIVSVNIIITYYDNLALYDDRTLE